MDFLKRYSGRTHSIGALLVSLIGSYYLVPGFKGFVDTLAALLPDNTFGHMVKGAVLAGVGLVIHYRQDNSGGGGADAGKA